MEATLSQHPRDRARTGGPAGTVGVVVDVSGVTVALAGEIDAELGDELLDAAGDVEAAALPVEVRAEAVTFMDSTGVAFLARVATRCPGRLRLVDPPELVRFLVGVTAITSLLDVVVSEQGCTGATPRAAGAAERVAVVEDRTAPDGA